MPWRASATTDLPEGGRRGDMRHHEQAQRADDEGSGVESERGRRSSCGDDDAADRGPEERRPDGLARAAEGVALGKQVRRQELRHDRPVGRIEERVTDADDSREHDEFGAGQGMGDRERSKCRNDAR
jgi:hypothetical protein